MRNANISIPLAVRERVINGQITGEDVVSAVLTISRVVEEKMGGTSGALYSCVSGCFRPDLNRPY